MALLFELKQKLSQGFSAFWIRWPRKVGKLEAEREWKKVVKPEDEDAIHAALDWQVPIFERRDPEHIPHARTWLHNRRWDDEKPAPPKPTMTRSPAIVRATTPEQITSQNVTAQIELLIKRGMSPEDAKQQVYREIGWVK